jgi:Ca-activated chloride channel family protein
VTEPLFFSVASSGATIAARILTVDQGAEWRFGAPDAPLLSAIARTTGGTFQPAGDDLSRTPRAAGASHHALAPWLLAVALLLWPADIALRRFQR